MVTSQIDGFSSANEMLRALRARQISAVELLNMHLARIERYNPALNAIVIPNYESAQRLAGAADQARARGEDAPLLGLPLTIKDWIEVEGLRSTAGDPHLKDNIAFSDSRVVARLRAAGGIILGKTNMAPWGGNWQTVNEIFGRSNNPWDRERTPGGSTGGGAAAVAAGLSPLEFGNDIGGSVRIPPAFCGIYGHKPSETALPRSGQTPDTSGRHLPNPTAGLAVIGPLARSADDLELALDVTCGPDQGEDAAWRLEIPPARHERLADYRVAVLPRIPWLPVDQEICAALERLASALSSLGVQLQEIQPQKFGDLAAHHALYTKLTIPLMSMGVSKEGLRQSAEQAHAFAKAIGDPFVEAYACGCEASAQDYIAWYGEREQYRAAYRQFFQDWDVLLTPVTFIPAFRHDQAPVDEHLEEVTFNVSGQPVPYMRLGVYAALATLSGQPATAFPFSLTRSGLPIGLQAIGPYLEDRTPIRFAALVAQEFGGFQAPPGY